MKGLGQVQEIAQDLPAMLAGDALRVELNPVRRTLPMLDAHDKPLVALGADLEFGGRARPLDDERMIAGGGKGSVQAAEEPARIVRNARRLAVHRRGRAHNLGPERLTDRLMAEADPEHRRRFARLAHEVETDPRLVRGA